MAYGDSTAAAAVVYNDSHAHLSYVLERLGSAALDGILSAYRTSEARILDPGVDFDDFPKRLELLGHHPNLRLAAGIWPDVPALPSVDLALEVLESHVKHRQCLAVGECGLDYHWMNGSEKDQIGLFTGQCEIALSYGKPLLVHSRQAAADTLAVVRRYAGRIPVIIHCFGYDADVASDFLSAGCYLSFAGNVTFAKQTGLQAALALVPENRLVLETDAPYMNPMPLRGKNSSPLDIVRTYAYAAALRSLALDELDTQVQTNLRTIFGPAW